MPRMMIERVDRRRCGARTTDEVEPTADMLCLILIANGETTDGGIALVPKIEGEEKEEEEEAGG